LFGVLFFFHPGTPAIRTGAFIPKFAQTKAAENPLDFSVHLIEDRSSFA
jgi:hypothetical protein